MDWTQIIMVVLSGTTIGGIVEAVRYRRQNKKIKQAEATNADTDAQKKQISLAELYLEKVMKLTETGNDNQRQMLEKLDIIDRRTDKQELQLNNIEEYLNGNYHQWLAEREKGGQQ